MRYVRETPQGGDVFIKVDIHIGKCEIIPKKLGVFIII
jgi:hypothetical protein